jgi:hypothetical protein
MANPNQTDIHTSAGLARLLLGAITRLEDEVALESEEMRAFVDIRLTAEILCGRLTAASEVSNG